MGSQLRKKINNLSSLLCDYGNSRKRSRSFRDEEAMIGRKPEMTKGMLRNLNISVGEGSKPAQTSKTIVAGSCWDTRDSQPQPYSTMDQAALRKIMSHVTALGYGIQGSDSFSKTKTYNGC